MKLYKLTDSKGYTRGQTKWGDNITHEASGLPGEELCTESWIHAYESPLLAALLNPVHANFQYPILWEADGEIGKRNGQIKCGCRKLTTVAKMEMPAVGVNQRIAFGILCAVSVYSDPEFVTWANEWLSGKDRSNYVAARDASYYASLSVNGLADSAASSALYACRAASGDYPAHLAQFTAVASEYAVYTLESLDLAAIAERAMEIV